MGKIERLRLFALINFGRSRGYISEIPDAYYNKLRYRYYKHIPASYYALFNVPGSKDKALVNILFTLAFDRLDEYSIVAAKSSKMGPHVYIEKDDTVFDPLSDIMAKKSFYEAVFKIKDKEYVSKDKILDSIKRFDVANEDIIDCQEISNETLASIEAQYNIYNGNRKALYKRQVESFFEDIKYKDGIMIIDIDAYGKKIRGKN